MPHRANKPALIVAAAITLPLVIGGIAFAGERNADDGEALLYHAVPVAVTVELPDVEATSPAPVPVVTATPTPTVAPTTPAPVAPKPTLDADELASGADLADAEPDPESELALGPEFDIPVGAERATVTRVIDGDTIEVNLNGATERVRLVDIDTPERGAAGFTEATNFTRNAIANVGNQVYLQPSGNNRDRFDRLRRNVWLETENGFVLLNDMLVQAGHARVWILRG